MKSLSSLLSIRKKKLKVSLTDKDIFYIFNRIIKEEFGNVGANNLTVDYFKNGKIFVRSKSSAWSNELFMLSATIAKKINQELGEEIILEIKMK
jgi:hypothetical protein